MHVDVVPRGARTQLVPLQERTKFVPPQERTKFVPPHEERKIYAARASSQSLGSVRWVDWTRWSAFSSLMTLTGAQRSQSRSPVHSPDTFLISFSLCLCLECVGLLSLSDPDSLCLAVLSLWRTGVVHSRFQSRQLGLPVNSYRELSPQASSAAWYMAHVRETCEWKEFSVPDGSTDVSLTTGTTHCSSAASVCPPSQPETGLFASSCCISLAN